ncbi:MAG: methionine--tRNA ligase subunit beta, partial [Sphingobacteriia bacterium]
PSQVPANEFLNLEGNKMSTSRNYAVWLHEYLAAFPDKVDVLRYVLAATMPETKDNDFSWKDYQARNNNELVAILGNFVNRVLTLIQKYYGGTVPPCPATQADVAERAELHRALQAEQAQYAQSLEKFRFRDALTTLMNMARAGNKYLADTEPWKRIQTDEAAVQAILYTATQLVAQLAVYAEPFLPGTAQQLGLLLDTPVPSLAQLHQQDAWQLVPAGRVLPQPTLLFTKIEDSTIAEQQQKLEAALAASAAQALPTSAPEDAVPMAAPVPAPKPEVAFPDFEKLDIRIATITAAERVPKADRLLKLTLDTGLDTRTVVSGIAEHYAPEDLVGQRVSVLLNLAPRKLKGIESQGMVLMAEGPDGKLRFVQPQEQAPAELPNGSVVR